MWLISSDIRIVDAHYDVVEDVPRHKVVSKLLHLKAKIRLII